MNEFIQRKANEPDDSYQIRLSLGLLNREMGYEELKWPDIKELLSSDMHYDTLRKMAYGIKIYQNVLDETKNDNVPHETILEIEEKIIEMKKEKVRLSDTRAMVNRDIRSLSRVENILIHLADNIDKLNTDKPLINNNINPVGDNYREGLLLCSDWHVGACFSNMNNEFSVDILKYRVNELVDKTIEIGLRNNISKLHVAAIGDLCNGLIHTVTRLENQINVATQVTFVSELISEMLDKLSKNFSLVSLSMTSSNHERFFADKKENNTGDSFHHFIREFIKLRTKGLVNVVIMDNDLDESLSLLNICNERIVLSHGDKDKKSSSVNRYAQILGYIPDMVCLGHYHSEYSHVEGKCRLTVNGSLMGGNQYAVDLRLYSPPEQSLIVFSDENGYECTHSIRFKEKY